MVIKWNLFWLVVLFPVVLTACNSSEEASPTAEAATQSIALSESFSREENGQTFQFNYPSGWVVADAFGMISLANSQAVLDLISSANIEEVSLPANSFGLQITQLPADQLPAEIDSPLSLLSMMMQSAAGDAAPTFGSPEELTINGNPAAHVAMTLPEGGSGAIYSLKAGDNYLFVVAMSPAYTDYANTTTAILQTITVQ